jgi:McrBC 5-methylcytosine restriction system component
LRARPLPETAPPGASAGPGAAVDRAATTGPALVTWVLPDRGRIELAASPRDVHAALGLAPLVNVVGLEGGRVRVEAAGGWVGSVVTEHLRVVLRPHALAPGTVAAMLAEAEGVAPREADAAVGDDLYAWLARRLCDEIARLAARGLRPEYVTRLRTGDPIRGEIAFERWLGPSSPTEGRTPPCRVRERTLDGPEHRLLASALAAVAGSPALDPPLRRRAATLVRRFGEAADAPPPPPGARYRRSGPFAPYAAALDLSLLLLGGLRGWSAEGVRRGTGFLVNVDRLLERWLFRRVRRTLPPRWTLREQEHLVLARDNRKQLDRFVDAIVRDEAGRVVAVLDAKNKLFARGRPPPRDDVHQVFSYAAASAARRACLLGLAEARAPGPLAARWNATWGALTLECVALPGFGPYAALCAALEEWAGRAFGEWAKAPG